VGVSWPWLVVVLRPLQDGEVGTEARLAIEEDAVNTHCSRLAFDGFVVCQPSHQPSFASRARWCMLCYLHPPSIVRVSRSIGCAATNRRSRLAFDGGLQCQPESAPVIRIARSMGVCWVNHHLHSSLGSCVRWVCAVPALPSTCPSPLAIDESVPCQPPPPLVLRFWRSMDLCHASAHLHPSFALAFDRSMPCQRPPPPVLCLWHSICLHHATHPTRCSCHAFDGFVLGASHHLSFAVAFDEVLPGIGNITFTCRSRLVFDGCAATSPASCSRFAFNPGMQLPPPLFHVSHSISVCWLPPPPFVRISRSMGMCCPSHYLHLSSVFCARGL